MVHIINSVIANSSGFIQFVHRGGHFEGGQNDRGAADENFRRFVIGYLVYYTK